MTTSSPAMLAHVASRFGLGGRPDAPITGDPMAWLTQQLGARSIVAGPSLDSCMTTLAAYTASAPGTAAKAQYGTTIRKAFMAEQQNFMLQAVTTAQPFQERLVRFWANHFAIQSSTIPTMALAGTFVRDVIRPNVNGPFSAMLQAAIQHPALLYSLNNQNSVGPTSTVATHRLANGITSSGINENLGRETLELFTVGVQDGYTQSDVDAIAYLLTGFSVNMSVHPYGFGYNPNMAQKGNSTLLGVTYPNTQLGCLGALQYLGTHPWTYMNLATKLARHFMSDAPSAGAITTIANALAASGGNLAAAANAMLSCQEAWVPLTKLRSPQDYVIALARGASMTAATAPQLNTLAQQLGEPVWQPPFPNGWPDAASDWCGPATIGARSAFASSFALGHRTLNPDTVSAGTVGPLLSANTQSILSGTADLPTRLTLLFASPEFQRR